MEVGLNRKVSPNNIDSKIRSVIGRRYLLEPKAYAHRFVDKGGKKGNVVIAMEHNNKT